jgi:hypothetical protein
MDRWWKKHLGDKDNELIKVEYKLSLNRVTSAKKVKTINFFRRNLVPLCKENVSMVGAEEHQNSAQS